MKDLIIVKKALSKDTCKLLARQFRMSREIICDLNPKMYDAGDDTVKKSFSWYAPLCFESLADTLIKDIIEEEVGHKLYVTYSYGRISYNGSILPKHIDRDESEYAVSCLIDTDRNWPIYFKVDGKDKKLKQEIGDIVIYKGTKLEHWRNPFLGTEQIGAFMFYVPEENKQLENDGRPFLGHPVKPKNKTWDKPLLMAIEPPKY